MNLLFRELLNVFFPNNCTVCGETLSESENVLCISCLQQMPRTNFHLQADNEVEKKFWGKVRLERATSFFRFSKGSGFQKLIHLLKYKNKKEIGEYLGKAAAAEISESGFFDDIDIIAPVPLHPNKLRKRGYNQSEWISRGVGQILGKQIDAENLYRAVENPTQTKKSVYERFVNTEGIFAVRDAQLFENKHILIVDDVLTTGSTIEACAQALKDIKGIKISVFTLATA
jgi:ComF family protein